MGRLIFILIFLNLNCFDANYILNRFNQNVKEINVYKYTDEKKYIALGQKYFKNFEKNSKFIDKIYSNKYDIGKRDFDELIVNIKTPVNEEEYIIKLIDNKFEINRYIPQYEISSNFNILSIKFDNQMNSLINFIIIEFVFNKKTKQIGFNLENNEIEINISEYFSEEQYKKLIDVRIVYASFLY
ncbi:MAG: hypothetical protein JXR70_09110 [Spirochaetales bacterium]|nr:hypothetical protein [Spirochaetales bacterium]